MTVFGTVEEGPEGPEGGCPRTRTLVVVVQGRSDKRSPSTGYGTPTARTAFTKTNTSGRSKGYEDPCGGSGVG